MLCLFDVECEVWFKVESEFCWNIYLILEEMCIK